MKNDITDDLLDGDVVERPSERNKAKSRSGLKTIVYPLSALFLVCLVIYKFAPQFAKKDTVDAVKLSQILTNIHNESETPVHAQVNNSVSGIQESNKVDEIEQRLAGVENEVKRLAGEQQLLGDKLSSLAGEQEQLQHELQSREESIAKAVVKVDSLEKKLKASYKKEVAKKIQEPIQLPVQLALISVRSYNGKIGVTFRQNSELSPTVLVGQKWRGWTLMSADVQSRQAVVGAYNQSRTLSM